MIRAICYYTNQEEDEPSSLREQQHQCLEAVHDYGWVIHREVFDPFMKKVKIAQRSGMRALLHEAAAHKFDLLVMMDKHFIGTCKEEAAVILIPRSRECSGWWTEKGKHKIVLRAKRKSCGGGCTNRLPPYHFALGVNEVTK